VDTLKQLDILDEDTLFVLTADHGEAIIRPEKVEDRMRRFDHCYANVDDLVRIPLVIQFPGGTFEPQKIDSQVSIIDILPTILDVADINEPEDG